MDRLIDRLRKDGWKNVQQGSYLETQYDLAGNRGVPLVYKSKILIKTIPVLDEKTAQQWLQVFKSAKKSKNWMVPNLIFICLVAETVGEEGIKVLVEGEAIRESAGIKEIGRTIGGSAYLFLVDKDKKAIFGTIPSLPLLNNREATRVSDALNIVYGRYAE